MTVDAQTTLRIEFDLNEDDLNYFRQRLEASRKSWKFRDDGRVVEGAKALIAEATKSNPPHYVMERVETLKTMLDMLTDHDWELKGDEREHVFDMLAYFADPKDIIPDHLPGVGFLDDAIMIELVAAELEPEIEAYNDFCMNRDELKSGSDDANPINISREYLQNRMRRRRRRRLTSTDGGAAMVASLFGPGGS
ncbi:MAG: YkvA family protein [Pseudomonadota bacterium]